MRHSWTYGVTVKQDNGDYVVSVRDLPEVVTSESTFEEAMELAADAIEVVVTRRIEDEEELPEPTVVKRGEIGSVLPAPLAVKAAIYRAWKSSGLKKTELGRKLGKHETEVRRILDPRHGTKLDQMEAVARALGGRLVVTFEAA